MPEASKPLRERLLERVAASRPGAYFYVNLAPGIDRFLIARTGGRITTGGVGRVGMLKVRGAKTGVERRTPLVFTRDGENVLVVASRGGDVRHPAWYRNVVANPDVSFSINGDERKYTARVASAAERSRLWGLVTRRYAGYDAYQRRAGEREIPIVVLEPRAGNS